MATDNTIKIKVTDAMVEDYRKSAIKWDKVLRSLPMRAANDVLKYFTPVSGLRGKKRFGRIGGNSQFAPFKKDRKSAASVDIDFREIETHRANVVETFSPSDYIDLPLAYDDPVITDAIKRAGSTLMVLAQLQIARGQHIAQCAMTGKRNAAGDTTVDVCDGLVTIAKAEIAAGNISESIGNLFKVGEAVTYANCCDVTKEIIFAMNQFLRREQTVMLCPSDYRDKYNESYLTTHHDVPYNDKYDQPWVEGSQRKLTLVGLPELDGTDMAIVTSTKNLLHGYYNESDVSALDIIREGHYDLSTAADMWMGFQFHTIDPRALMIVDLSAGSGSGEAEEEQPQGEQQEGGNQQPG